jgi:hypothetical protein
MKRFALALAVFAAGAVPSSAATIYRLDATSPSTIRSDFWLTFEDLDGDTYFSLNELIAFSGVTVEFSGVERLFDQITAVPLLPARFLDGGAGFWTFTGASGPFTTARDNWTITPSRVSDAPVVPLPAAGWLMLGALGGLAALRRRKP